MNFFKKVLLRIKNETSYFLKTRTNKKVYLFGTEDFGNLGDHQIAISEIEFLNKYYKDYEIIEIPASKYYRHIKVLKKYIKKGDLIFTTGGGNLGDQYPFSEGIRRDVISKFTEQKIVIFPQTIYFTDTEKGKEELNKTKEIYNKHKNLTIMTREETSYNFAKNNFTCNVILTPDIVLFSDYTNLNYKREQVLLCLRSDVEGILTEEAKKSIEADIKREYSQYKYTDTQLDYNVSVKDRKEYLNNFMIEVAKSKLVITDRLHGMVFCAITKTPCIIFSNYNYKVKGVYNWIRHLDYIVFLQDYNKVSDAINKLKNLDNISFNNKNLIIEFDNVERKLKR